MCCLFILSVSSQLEEIKGKETNDRWRGMGEAIQCLAA